MAKSRPAASRSERFDLYQHVTNQIVAALDQGVRPWVQPWSAEHLARRVSRPLRAGGKNYRGINVLVLWLTAAAKGYGSPYWLTFKQALEMGGNVRKGEHGAKVCYFDRITREAVDQNTGATTEQHIPFVKTYTVFSAEQCENLPVHFTAVPAPVSTPAADEARLAHVEAFVAHTGADIRYGGDRACYSITTNRISMPPFPAFVTAHDFYSTELHELVHWTRHEKRLNRDCGRKRWGDEGYAMEELVAELGSAFLYADLGIDLSNRTDHASYIDSWLRILRGDRRAIFQAAAMAEHAADWLHACQPAAGEHNADPLTVETPAVAAAPAETRAFEAAEALCSNRLLEAVTENVPAIDPDRPLLPASLGVICPQCGRHHDERHGEGCLWSSPGDTAAGDDGPATPDIPWMV